MGEKLSELESKGNQLETHLKQLKICFMKLESDCDVYLQYASDKEEADLISSTKDQFKLVEQSFKM